jgi:hypothetical protein
LCGGGADIPGANDGNFGEHGAGKLEKTGARGKGLLSEHFSLFSGPDCHV